MAPAPLPWANRPASGRLVGYQQGFELGDLVLELELALLQPPHREFVRPGVALQPRDRGVEVAVRLAQFHQAVGYADMVGGVVDAAHATSIARSTGGGRRAW